MGVAPSTMSTIDTVVNGPISTGTDDLSFLEGMDPHDKLHWLMKNQQDSNPLKGQEITRYLHDKYNHAAMTLDLLNNEIYFTSNPIFHEAVIAGTHPWKFKSREAALLAYKIMAESSKYHKLLAQISFDEHLTITSIIEHGFGVDATVFGIAVYNDFNDQSKLYAVVSNGKKGDNREIPISKLKDLETIKNGIISIGYDSAVLKSQIHSDYGLPVNYVIGTPERVAQKSSVIH